MKRKIIINTLTGTNQIATIVIDKDGMRIDNRSDNAKHERNDYFYRHFIKNCLDMDEWQESWYIDISKAMTQRTEDRKKCVKVIRNKIAEREIDILFLKDGLQILSECK